MQLDSVEAISREVREVLWKLSPEIVSAAESFAEHVLYVPISATGRSPELDPKTGAFGVRPRDIRPMWAEVPLLYGLNRAKCVLVPSIEAASGSSPQDRQSSNQTPRLYTETA